MYGSTLFVEGKDKQMKIDINRLKEVEQLDKLTFFAGEIVHLINNSLCPVVLGLERIKKTIEEEFVGTENNLVENEKIINLAIKGVYRCTEVTGALLAFIREKRED